MSTQTPETLAAIVTAPYRDEETLNRAAQASATYRALADAIEADPDLAPGCGASFTFYAPSTGIGDLEKTFFAAARRLFPDAKIAIDNSFAFIEGDLAGEKVTFKAFKSDVLVKRTVLREVEEYVPVEKAS